jgi:membrane fusion protein (multidrug efflux system)
MKSSPRPASRAWIAASLLLLVVAGTAAGLYFWKKKSLAAADAAAASQPEPSWSVTAGVARPHTYVRTTTSVGTVVALQSITLHNELPGTVSEVNLEPGTIVEPGTVLVALDVSVEEAELKAQEAEGKLAQAVLERMERAESKSAASAGAVDRARAERDIALAQIKRTKAVIARKTIRAPFRARVGIANVHLGQYLDQGALLTTLQGIDDAVHVEFMVTQMVADGLQPGANVEIYRAGAAKAQTARIVAVDARVDTRTRNAKIRARLEGKDLPAPGASVRVEVPVGAPSEVVTVPVNALRKGPAGDFVYVLEEQNGQTRAAWRLVRAGTTLGDNVVIQEGIEVGERVAASGSFKLYPQALVAVSEDKPLTQTSAAEARGN